jgi:hypothetical protein
MTNWARFGRKKVRDIRETLNSYIRLRYDIVEGR